MSVISLSEKVAFIDRVFGKGGLTRDARNYDVRCPLCNDPDRSKRKLSINVANDLNQCWVCGWTARNLVGLIRRFGTSEDLREYQHRFLGLSPLSAAERPPVERPHLPDDFHLLANGAATLLQKRAVRYLLGRGLTHDDLWRFRFGTSEQPELFNRVIFPSFDARGHLNYYVARSLDPRNKKRYVNPPVDRRDVVFNEMMIDWTREIVVCEGPFDGVKCGDNAVPLLGNRLHGCSRLFSLIVSNRTPVAIALDSAEVKKTLDLSRLLQNWDISVRIIDQGGAKDPGEMTKEAFQDALQQATSASWKDDLSARLRLASSVSLNNRRW